jgi:hypothetical protein
VGSELEAIHPVIRTNPVTGWKSVFGVGHHVQQINGLTPEESRRALDWFVQLIVENHDLQVRHRWQNPNDLGKLRSLFGLKIVELTTTQLYGIIDPSIIPRPLIMRDTGSGPVSAL